MLFTFCFTASLFEQLMLTVWYYFLPPWIFWCFLLQRSVISSFLLVISEMLVQVKKNIFSCRLGRRAGLLHPPEHHAPAAPAGSAGGGDPGGYEDGWQGAERLHPRLRAESQTHRAGRETDGSRGWDNNHICSLKSGTKFRLMSYF